MLKQSLFILEKMLRRVQHDNSNIILLYFAVIL